MWSVAVTPASGEVAAPRACSVNRPPRQLTAYPAESREYTCSLKVRGVLHPHLPKSPASVHGPERAERGSPALADSQPDGGQHGPGEHRHPGGAE